MKLTEKYAPKRLAHLVGQEPVVAGLRRWLGSPFPVAFLFAGASGVGKTSAGLALANELGIAADHGEFGGLFQIASGEQTADSVRRLARMLWNVPMFGSGWKLVLVNECDRMSEQAEAIWLDVLEALPPRVVVVFTTNHPEKLSERFADRCTALPFNSGREDLGVGVGDLVRRIWQAEGLPGKVEDAFRNAKGIYRDGHLSARRCIEVIQQYQLTGAKPEARPESVAKPEPVTAGAGGSGDNWWKVK